MLDARFLPEPSTQGSTKAGSLDCFGKIQASSSEAFELLGYEAIELQNPNAKSQMPNHSLPVFSLCMFKYDLARAAIELNLVMPACITI